MTAAIRYQEAPSVARTRALRVAIAVAIAVVTIAAAPANPAAAADRREPPDVVGKPLAEAQTLIQEQWYPGIRSFTPTISVTPDPLPEQVPPDAARVVDQAVVQYLEDSIATASRAAVIDLTAGPAVPDLEGRTRDEARTVVDGLGLSLKATGTGLVDQQDPAAGSLVPFGTTVQVVLRPPASATSTTPARSEPSRLPSTAAVSDDSEPASWVGWPAGAALLAVVVLALWSLRSRRSPRRRPPQPSAPPDVRVEPRPDPAPVVSVHPQAADPELVVRVVPGPDLGRLTLTEEPR